MSEQILEQPEEIIKEINLGYYKATIWFVCAVVLIMMVQGLIILLRDIKG